MSIVEFTCVNCDLCMKKKKKKMTSMCNVNHNYNVIN
jgi:hypothetical protein